MGGVLPLDSNGKVEERGILQIPFPLYLEKIKSYIFSPDRDYRNVILEEIVRYCIYEKLVTKQEFLFEVMGKPEMSLIELIFSYKDFIKLKTKEEINDFLSNLKLLCNELSTLVDILKIKSILAIDVSEHLITIIYKKDSK